MIGGVPLNVELRNESGEVLAAAGGDGLLDRLAQAAGPSSACLRWIDPYGGTVFNTFQAQALADELDALRPTVDANEAASLEALLRVALECARGVHLYVWCIGD